MTALLGRIESIINHYRQLNSTMSLVRVNIEQAAHLFQLTSVQTVIPEITRLRLDSILMEISVALDEVSQIVKRPYFMGKAYLIVGSSLSCFGAQPLTRRLRDLSDELKQVLQYTSLFLEASATEAANKQIYSGPKQRFRTESQKRFWEEKCGNSSYVDYDTITHAFSLLDFDPVVVCKHAALGILSGKDGVTPESASEAFGDMSPRAWLRSRKRGPSRTIAFAGHVDNVNFVCAREKWMATCSDDRTIKVFREFVMLHVLVAHERAVIACHINTSADQLYSASDDHTVRGWNLKTGDLMWTHKTGIRYPRGITGYNNEVVFFCHDSSEVVVLSNRNGVPVNRVLSTVGIISGVHYTETRLLVVSNSGYATTLLPDDYQFSIKTPFLNPRIFASDDGACTVWSRTKVAIVQVSRKKKNVVEEAVFPDPVEHVYDARICEIAGESILLVAWKAGEEDTRVSEFVAEGLAGRHASVFVDCIDTYVSCVNFDEFGNLYAGFENGSTIFLARTLKYATHKMIVGCRYNSNYFPEQASQGNQLMVSGVQDIVLIGPRIPTASGGKHGLNQNMRQAAIMWNIQNNSVTDVMNHIAGTVAHTPMYINDFVWILCKQQGHKSWIERFGVNNHLTQKIKITESDMVPRYVHSMSEKYVVMQMIARTGGDSRIVVQDVDQPDARIWTLENRNIVTSLQTVPVMIIENNGTLQYADFRHGMPPTINDIPIDATGFNVIHACDAYETGIMLLTDSEFVLIPDVFANRYTICSVPAPPEAVGVLKIAENRFVTCGNYGRFFVYSFNPLKQLQTCVTHPSRTIYSQKSKDVLTWDSMGAILSVSKDFLC